MKKAMVMFGIALLSGAYGAAAQDSGMNSMQQPQPQPNAAAQQQINSAIEAQQLAQIGGPVEMSAKQRLAVAEASISGEKIRAHVKFLADDLLEGRGPGLRGAEIASQYIATQFALYGLKPGGDNGTYLQQINFVGMKARPAETHVSISGKAS